MRHGRSSLGVQPPLRCARAGRLWTPASAVHNGDSLHSGGSLHNGDSLHSGGSLLSGDSLHSGGSLHNGDSLPKTSPPGAGRWTRARRAAR